MPPILEGPNIRLRPPCKADTEARFLLGSDPDIAEMFGVGIEDVRPITRERAAAWVRNLVEQSHAWVIEIQGLAPGRSGWTVSTSMTAAPQWQSESSTAPCSGVGLAARQSTFF
ncbi:hypothetical protein [Sinorhizobium mexicanum]|uniref:GNAT family N-acetyltransferase n=1 Tax=Sinorhizobium mexicanum TaxID=375549 RepID=UPI001D83501D|nr:hypothetical protein [Sinorhizobium mexicanum]